MLIKALCDYYDILSKEGKVLPEGYSNVKIHYLIALSADGMIDEIIDCQKTEEVPAGKGKMKTRKVPAEMRTGSFLQTGSRKKKQKIHGSFAWGRNMESPALRSACPEARTICFMKTLKLRKNGRNSRLPGAGRMTG